MVANYVKYEATQAQELLQIAMCTPLTKARLNALLAGTHLRLEQIHKHALRDLEEAVNKGAKERGEA